MGPATATYMDSAQRDRGLVAHALTQENASSDHSLLSDVSLAAASEDEREQLYLVELRYQQYLAQRGLQELFESGEQRPLES